MTKLKAFADDKLNVATKEDRIENFVGKGENAGYQLRKSSITEIHVYRVRVIHLSFNQGHNPSDAH